MNEWVGWWAAGQVRGEVGVWVGAMGGQIGRSHRCVEGWVNAANHNPSNEHH